MPHPRGGLRPKSRYGVSFLLISLLQGNVICAQTHMPMCYRGNTCKKQSKVREVSLSQIIPAHAPLPPPSPLLSLVHLAVISLAFCISLPLVLFSNSLYHIPVPVQGLHYDTGIHYTLEHPTWFVPNKISLSLCTLTKRRRPPTPRQNFDVRQNLDKILATGGRRPCERGLFFPKLDVHAHAQARLSY